MKCDYVKITIVAMVVATCGNMRTKAFADQNGQGGIQKAPSPAVPLAKPNADEKPQNTANRGTKFNQEAYERFLKALKPSTDALGMAQALFEKGDFAGAERMAQEAIRLSGNIPFGNVSSARNLIGQIRLEQGRYKEALPLLQVEWQEGGNTRQDLDIALCYVRLGNYRMARQYYSEQAYWQRSTFTTLRDLPGTRTPQTLEASILLARGSDSYTRSREEEAFKNFSDALKIVPNNGLAAYKAGKALFYLNRRDEAGPYFVKAVQNGGNGYFVDEARRYVPLALQDQIASVPKRRQTPTTGRNTQATPQNRP